MSWLGSTWIRWLLLRALALGAVAGTLLGAEGSVWMQLEEAAWREEILADYNAAIRIHQQVLDRPALSDRVKVEAIHRMGVCFTMKGNLTPAVNLFLRVLREYPGFEPFTQRATFNLMLLSPETSPSDRSWYTDERVYLGDLGRALDAAFAHGEIGPAQEVVQEAIAGLRVLEKQLEGEDQAARRRELRLFESLEAALAGGRIAAAATSWRASPEREGILDRRKLFVSDDCNAWLVASRDRLARALDAGDAAGAETETRWIRRYAEVVREQGLALMTVEYLDLLAGTAQAISERVAAGRFDEARAVLRQGNRSVNRTYGAFTLLVPGREDFADALHPELVAVLTWVEQALDGVTLERGETDPVKALREALVRVGRLAERVGEGRARERLRKWEGDFSKVLEMLEAGDEERARRFLQAYEL